MTKWILIAIIFILLLAFPLYQLSALNSVGISSFQIDKIAMDKSLLFSIQGKIMITNPSHIPATIREIPYVGYIDDVSVFNGTLSGQTIPASGTAAFAFDQEIDWVPDPTTALAILNGKNVTLTIHTSPKAAYLSVFTLSSEKEISFSISDMIKPYIREQIASMSSLIGSLLG
ncbi:hypothetical protein HZA99_06740 [Candidatus Woesearchaeota archaeon]|nr:hypothetical protein [Candidatus Woesearchaeota archaeon]